MELTKTKFKQTEIGLIPEDWDIVELGEIGNFKNGINKSKEDFGFGFPFVNLMDVFGKPKIYGNEEFDLINSNEAERNLYDLRKGDIIFIRSSVKPSGVGLTSVVSVDLKKTVFSGFLIRYRENIGIHNEYKRYCFYEEKFRNELISNSSVSANTNINQEALKKLKLSLPPLPEQKAIAQVLSDTDNLIQAIEQKLTKKRAIKQGAMQQLLTPKEDWEVKKLGDIANYRRGSFPQPYGLPQWYDENNGTPFVQVFDVDKNMRLKSTTKQKISDLAKDKSVFVRKGNVVITLQGSIGRIAITQYDAYVDRTLLIFTDYKVPIDKVFFAFVIQEKFRIEKENAPGGIIKTITKEELSKFDIPLPKSKEEQTEIATILSDMDAEIEQLEEKVSKYKMVKQGLMQNLLTGKIRLV
jgi:type I restriction enzyme S subunit